MANSNTVLLAIRHGYRETAKGALSAMLYTYFTEDEDGSEWEAVSDLCSEFLTELDNLTDS